MTKSDILRLVHEKCIDCCCGQVYEVKLCPAKDCPLHPLRNGKDPQKRVMSEAQKEALAKARSVRK